MTHAALKDQLEFMRVEVAQAQHEYEAAKLSSYAPFVEGKHRRLTVLQSVVAALSAMEGEDEFEDWSGTFEGALENLEQADTAPPPQQAAEREQDGVAGLVAKCSPLNLLAGAIRMIESSHDAAPTKGTDDGLAALYNLRDRLQSGSGQTNSFTAADKCCGEDNMYGCCGHYLTTRRALATQPQQAGGDAEEDADREICASCYEATVDENGHCGACPFRLSTPPQPEAGGGVTDAMVEAAWLAYERAAVADGFEGPNDSERRIAIPWMRAALTAALSTTPASGGEHGN